MSFKYRELKNLHNHAAGFLLCESHGNIESNATETLEVIQWCLDQFGERGKECRWDGNGVAFLFRHATDGLAFKLRWC